MEELIIYIKKRVLANGVFIEIKKDAITYTEISKEPKIISDVNFINKILNELYLPIREHLKEHKNNLENMQLNRPKNSASYELAISDNEFKARFDLYVTEMPEEIREFCDTLVKEIENILLT